MQSRGGGQRTISPSAAFQLVREEEGGSFSKSTNEYTKRTEDTPVLRPVV